MPILLDCYGMQPLDYAMATITKEKEGKQNKYDTKFMVMKKDKLQKINKSNNLPLVQTIFEQTQHYGFLDTLPTNSIIKAVR